MSIMQGARSIETGLCERGCLRAYVLLGFAMEVPKVRIVNDMSGSYL